MEVLPCLLMVYGLSLCKDESVGFGCGCDFPGIFLEDMHHAYMESSTVLRKALNPQIVKTKRSSSRKKDCDQYQRSNPHAGNQATF